jgi:uracil DNA glycosylase
MDNMDWKAALSSEIFREYAKNEMKRIASEKEKQEKLSSKTADDFCQFEKKVNASPILRDKFKKLQNVFINNPEYTKTIDQNFVQGVLLLNIKD